MTVKVGTEAGADDLGITYVREEGTASPLKVGLSPRGTHLGELSVEDNAYITILDEHRVFAKQPRLTAGGTAYFDETEYSTQRALPPIIYDNGDYAGFIDASGSAAVYLEGTAWEFGGGMGTHRWDLRDGSSGTYVGATPGTILYPLGERHIYHHYTDSQSPAQTRTRAIFVAALNRPGGTATTYLPLKVSEVKQHLRADGQRYGFNLYEPVSVEWVPVGGRVIAFEEERYDGVTGSLNGAPGREHVKFTGWLDDELSVVSGSRQGTIKTTTLTAFDVAGKMRKRRSAPLTGRRKNADDVRWGEIRDATLDRLVAMLLTWMSTASQVAPIRLSGTGATWAFRAADATGGSLWSQVADPAYSAAFLLTCDQNGIIRLKRDPLLIDSGDRDATEIVTLQIGDWRDLKVTRMEPRVGEIRAEGQITSTQDADNTDVEFDPAYTTAPNKFGRGQGSGRLQLLDLLVSSQTEQNARIGHMYAMENNPFSPFEYDIARVGDARIDPALLEWVRLNLTEEEAAQRGLPFTTQRQLPIEVEITHRFTARGNVKSVRLVTIGETVGTPGETDPPPAEEEE